MPLHLFRIPSCMAAVLRSNMFMSYQTVLPFSDQRRRDNSRQLSAKPGTLCSHMPCSPSSSRVSTYAWSPAAPCPWEMKKSQWPGWFNGPMEPARPSSDRESGGWLFNRTLAALSLYCSGRCRKRRWKGRGCRRSGPLTEHGCLSLLGKGSVLPWPGTVEELLDHCCGLVLVLHDHDAHYKRGKKRTQDRDSCVGLRSVIPVGT